MTSLAQYECWLRRMINSYRANLDRDQRDQGRLEGLEEALIGLNEAFPPTVRRNPYRRPRVVGPRHIDDAV